MQKNIAPIIALLTFFATSIPSQAIADENSQRDSLHREYLVIGEMLKKNPRLGKGYILTNVIYNLKCGKTLSTKEAFQSELFRKHLTDFKKSEEDEPGYLNDFILKETEALSCDD